MHPPEERLSEYLDGTLAEAEATALETHLEACQACRELLADLRRVLARAQALEDRAPREDLWPGVAAAIGAAPRRARRISFSLPQLAAAGVALMLVSGGVAALLLSRSPGAMPVVGPRPEGRPGSSTVLPASEGNRGYDAAIQALERQLDRRRGRLDSTTVRVVEQKLALIDRAILEAERALATDASDPYLYRHLARTRQQKLELLRHATALSLQ